MKVELFTDNGVTTITKAPNQIGITTDLLATANTDPKRGPTLTRRGEFVTIAAANGEVVYHLDHLIAGQYWSCSRVTSTLPEGCLC